MRRSAFKWVILLAVLLTASQAAFASHLTTHLGSKLSNCEWCVCQGQNLAAPLPSAEPPALTRWHGWHDPAQEIVRLPQPLSPSYQPRAPPSIS